eukprot:gnl/MRDRNA2_/MRDRNA2_29853_c0_seq1.p1 gnl/MRDRNA2_/MRDRNA2_29853_c0~~gnl/MRDRNA2_/MRDRNA2_29853_c0_seq1.p1  ORF type:complete len:341 (-),score=45.17 gnl/MRDRNA2_/MRDRNA2_29853_c0_seq1:188-1210(-)
MSNITISNGAFCINLHYFEQRDGATINLWSANGHDSQKWLYEDGAIKLAANRNFCITLHCFSKTHGAQINLWTYTGHPSQKWDICGGKIKLHSDHKWVLNLHYMSLTDGAIVNLWEDNGHDSQKWSWVRIPQPDCLTDSCGSRGAAAMSGQYKATSADDSRARAAAVPLMESQSIQSSPSYIQFSQVEREKITRKVKAKTIEIAADQLAQVVMQIAAAVASGGTLAPALLSGLGEKLKLSLQNETRSEAIYKYAVDEDSRTLVVVSLNKSAKDMKGCFLFCSGHSVEIFVDGEVHYIVADTAESYKRLKTVVSTKALTTIESLLKEASKPIDSKSINVKV